MAGAKHALEVLRYWRALLEHQEALGTRPKARRATAQGAPSEPNLLDPAPGQDYFKLPLAGAERFLVERAELPPLALDAERAQYLEDWLAQRYRRGEDDDAAFGELVLFPVVHLPKDELAGLLRFPVELSWRVDDRPFEVPSAEQRAKRRPPAAPTAIRLAHAGKDPEQSLPFFVDARLLRRTLGVEPEAIELFFGELRKQPEVAPARMVEALCVLLEADTGDTDAAPAVQKAAPAAQKAAPAADGDGNAQRLLERLQRAVAARLAEARSKSRVYPVALVVSCQHSRATWHVQRDLGAASDHLEADALDERSPLYGYLEGKAPAARPRPCFGRFADAPLTDSQRKALELALGARLSAIQGPPGTGKTTLILNAVMHQLVEKYAPVASDQPPREGVLLVTSTNNRAVDNVLEPLASGRFVDCPLGLRLGNREVMASTSARTLSRLETWLARSSPPSDAEWRDTKRRFAARFAALQERLSSSPEALQHELERARARREALAREAVPGASAPRFEAALGALASASGQAVDALRGRAEAAREPLTRAAQALEALSRRSEEGPAALDAVERGYRRFTHEHLSPLERALGLGLDLRLPPAALEPSAIEAWEEGLERALGALHELSEALDDASGRSRTARELATLDARIAELTAALAAARPRADENDLDAELLALSLDALALRQGFLRSKRAPLADALRTALAHCSGQRSLRGLLAARRGAGQWLRQAFPAFGCTLLSLGNAFPPEPELLEHVIVDEAGQCHGAYAVSALLRARSATLVGDVHQLEPVHELGQDDERRIRRSLRLAVDDEAIEPYRMYEESGRSAQSLAERAFPERPTLRDHFRCQPEIVALCEAWCGYGMVARTPRASLAPVLPELCASVLFRPTAGEQRRFAASWYNEAELAELLGWVRRLLSRGIPPKEVALITPYRGQSEAIFRALRAEGLPIEKSDGEDDEGGLFERQGGLALGTVHRFQGGERRVVLFSTTVTERRSLAFIDERVNLLNVAASRAKEHLIVIGHEPTLRAGANTRVLVEGQPRLAAPAG